MDVLPNLVIPIIPFTFFFALSVLLFLFFSPYIPLSFSFLAALDSTPAVQTCEWRHQVVPTVLRPNVRRPQVAPAVETPVHKPVSSSPLSLTPAVLSPLPPTISSPPPQAQTSISLLSGPVSASFSDAQTGTHATHAEKDPH